MRSVCDEYGEIDDDELNGGVRRSGESDVASEVFRGAIGTLERDVDGPVGRNPDYCMSSVMAIK